jgi:glutathione synthase/RimK-type ligase-like ATP-grasp enzyme
MKKITIGYIFNEERMTKDEEIFLESAKKKNIELVMINTSKDLTEEALENKIKKCRILFNNSAEEFSTEIVKTIEELGKKVIDSSKKTYYEEDKWLFFLKCKKNNIPTLKTILLSENISTAKRELEDLGLWPVVLKRIQGTMGQYVDRAKNLRQAERIIKRFWRKGAERLPIIAQEFVSSPSYRVTIIGKKVVQTAIKRSKGWKSTGVYLKDENVESFKVDKELKKIVDRLIKVFSISICGVDLLKKDNKWLVLEINSDPALDFFEKERKKLVCEVLDFLKREARANSRK